MNDDNGDIDFINTIGGNDHVGTFEIPASKSGMGVHLLEKEERIKAYRKEASRLAAIANKRIERLEKNGLENSPAYQGYLKSGGGKFSVKGKDHNELQAEVSRINKLIKANTSTVRGVNNYLKGMAKDTGMKYKNLKELQVKADEFFKLSSKIEEYLTTVEDMASAIGYQKIWESINVFIKDNKIDLTNTKMSIEEMTETISKAIAEYEKPEYVKSNEVEGNSVSAWFTLPLE